MQLQLDTALNIDNQIVLMQEQQAKHQLCTIKTPEEITKMREIGRITANILDEISQYIVPGMTSRKLEAILRDLIVNKYGVEIDRTDLEGNNHNDLACMSISRNFITAFGELDDIPFQKGEIVGMDVSCKKDGWASDTTRIWMVGQDCSRLARSLLSVAYEAMWIGINMVKPGVHIGSIGYAVEQYVESKGFTIMKTPGQFGHSIGQEHNEGLLIPFYGCAPYTGHILEEGMVITIEPGVTYGDAYGYRLKNPMGTMSTSHHVLGCYWEHVVAVTRYGYEILDLREGESEYPDPKMYGYNPNVNYPHF